MDLFILQSMVFVLLLVLLVGGFVLALPVTRRLGDALDEWIRLRRERELDADEADRLREELDGLRDRLETLERETDLLAEQQSFTESLLGRTGDATSGEGEPRGGETGP